MDKKSYTLPTAAEIVERLKKANDDAYLVETFYPTIAKEAGRELIAEGIVMMFTLKIYDYQQSGYRPVIGSILQMQVPRFIDALVDDKEVAEAAKAFHQEAVDATHKK